jgi:hypothetical protein
LDTRRKKGKTYNLQINTRVTVCKDPGVLLAGHDCSSFMQVEKMAKLTRVTVCPDPGILLFASRVALAMRIF